MSPPAASHPVRLARQAKRNANGDTWRLEDLAEAIGKSISLCSNIEHGYLPKPATREKLAKALDTTVEELWPDEYPENE